MIFEDSRFSPLTFGEFAVKKLNHRDAEARHGYEKPTGPVIV